MYEYIYKLCVVNVCKRCVKICVKNICVYCFLMKPSDNASTIK